MTGLSECRFGEDCGTAMLGWTSVAAGPAAWSVGSGAGAGRPRRQRGDRAWWAAGTLRALPDPRGRRGRRHPLATLLVIAAAAVLTGARSFAAIGQFSRTLPQATLARLGTFKRPWSTWHVAPSETTLRWVLQQVDADELDRIVGGWLAEQAAAGQGPIAVDGKVLRGARGPGGHQVHLLAALAHDSGTVLAQRAVAATTNQTTQLAPLLDGVDLAGRVVTADALHTTPAQARYLIGRDADYMLTVKGNQPGLVTAIDRLAPEVFSPGAHHR